MLVANSVGCPEAGPRAVPVAGPFMDITGRGSRWRPVSARTGEPAASSGGRAGNGKITRSGMENVARGTRNIP